MICTNGINRQEQLNALVSSLLEQAECQLDLVFLAERGADLAALCLGEGVGHAAADDDGVALVDQVLDNADLVGNLSAAQDCNERTSRVAQSLAHDGDFLLDQEAAYSRQVICDACGGSVCTVCGAECVVDVNVSHVSHSLCQRSVVLGLALFKANILKQNDLARLNLSGQLLSVLAYNVLCQLDFLAKQLAQALSDRSQRILHVYFALRTAEVRAQDLAGGLMVTQPSEADYRNPELKPYIEKYLKGVASVPTEDRMRLLRLIENMTMGTAAVGYLPESMHGAGSPQAQRIMIARQSNLEMKKELAKKIARIK